MNRVVLMPVVAAVVVLAAARPVAAQVTTVEVMKSMVKVVAYEEKKGNQVLFAQVDNVKKDYVKSQTLTLEAGFKYRVYAIGDADRITDLDLTIDDAAGKSVGQDNDTSNVAIVDVTVNKTQQYKLKASPYTMANGMKDGFFALVIVRLD